MGQVILYLKLLYGFVAILVGIVFLVWLCYEVRSSYTFKGVKLVDLENSKKARNIYRWWIYLVILYWAVFILTHFLIGWRQWNHPL